MGNSISVRIAPLYSRIYVLSSICSNCCWITNACICPQLSAISWLLLSHSGDLTQQRQATRSLCMPPMRQCRPPIAWRLGVESLAVEVLARFALQFVAFTLGPQAVVAGQVADALLDIAFELF